MEAHIDVNEFCEVPDIGADVEISTQELNYEPSDAVSKFFLTKERENYQ